MKKKLYASIDLWLQCAILLPFLTIIHWALAFVPYAFILATCSWRLLYYGKSRTGVPLWLVVQAAILALLATLYISDPPTLLNIAALLATNVMFMALFLCVPNTEEALVYFFTKFRTYLFVLAAYGFVLSSLLASRMGWDNPAIDLFTGQRVRIFSAGFGHSALIDVGINTFTITLAMFDKRKIRRDLGFLFVSAIIILLARAAIGYLGIAGAVVAFLIERLNIGKYFKNLIYIVLIPTFAFTYLNYGDEILTQVRTLQVGSRTVNAGYGTNGDLSAGRDELNSYLMRLIEKSPWTGIGVTNKLLQDGLSDKNGHLIARVESPLRVGVKYGVIYFLLIVIACIYSCLILFTSDVRFRIIGMAIALYNLDAFIGNGLFETAQSYNFFLALFPTIFLGEYARRSMFKRPAQRRYNQQAYAQGRPMR